MFSALKRLTSKNESLPSSGPPGHHTMSQNLQKKFAKGIQYNMKIIIKGDRNVGKTCLFHRLQGKKFIEEYTPTEEIQVASIQWNYKATDDVVKVEVWDVVDKGKKRVLMEGLKLGENDASPPALDAEFLDVYKGTNGVILVLDITKSWSFDYVQKELAKVPAHIPVLVLGNHCDMSHHRTVTADIAAAYIDTIQRPLGSAQIRYAEASMSNGFGLKLLHKFFCLPFLQLQRQTLLGQLERNQAETQATLEELDLFQQSEHADYDKFIENLTSKRRQQADLNSKNAPVISSSQSAQQISPAMSDRPQPVRPSPSVPEMRLAAPPPQPFPNTPVTAKILGRPSEPVDDKVAAISSKIHSVEEFVPDGGELDRSFLEESPTNNKGQVREDPVDSDSEVETGNPLVAGFQDDLDPEDTLIVSPPSPTPPQTELAKRSVENGHFSPQETEDVDGGCVDITGDALDEWGATLGVGGRVSPEGGEDSGPGNHSPDTMLQASDKQKGEKTKKSKQKKKTNSKDKEKESLNKEEKKTKKKKSSRRSSTVTGPAGERDELEEFLNSHDSAYEAF
ncbi:rab-like protein 6 [Macrosteles quadrilineatus]|uniref:rab-like protein 6 n=1 Tax=Macrosteles quadrilineatus TaxID=74068 RepID=UPI0023E2DCED|nr:rab-like protein 6 [Macrosteles quadrilineatus]